jgi:hypothetical protein
MLFIYSNFHYRCVMIMLKDIKKLFHQLIHDDKAEIDLGGSNISVRLLNDSSRFTLTTPIYLGGNFIPKSVRNCLSEKAPFGMEGIKTSTSVDEHEFKVYLHYLGSLDHINGDKFHELLESFSWLADEWRLYLDEHDRNDLVHIHHPR